MILNLTRADLAKMSLWPALAAFMLAFAWLQPHHYPPWQGFHEDAWAAAWMSLAGILLLVSSLRNMQWSLAPLMVVALACVAWMQWFAGMIADSGQILLFSSHLIAFALCWVVARSYTEQRPFLVGDILFSAIGIASLGNGGIAIYQWLQITPKFGLEGLGIWVMALPEFARAAGNTAQPNEMATLLSWGIVAGLWARMRQTIRWPVLLLYCIFLAIGLALSQSRIGILEVLALTLCAAWMRRLLGGWTCALILALTLLVQILLLLNASEILDVLGLKYRERELSSMVQDAARVKIYTMVIQAISLSPWIGYGASHQTTAQWAVLEIAPPLYAFYMQSHNWGLDLMLWFGVPLGLICISLILAWCWKTFRLLDSPQVLLASMALLVFAMHASVELPHWAANYLLIAAVLGGYVCASTRRRVYWQSGRGASLIYVLTLTAILYACIYDYLRLERNFVQIRAEQLRVRTDISEVPASFVLTHLADNLRISRIKSHPGMPPETLAWMRRSVISNPNYLTMFQYILALGLNGKHEEAGLWMRRLNSVSPKAYVGHYARVWSIHQAEHPSLIGHLKWADQ
jgi:hypothetical protein